jgi:hypothetical protein
MSRRIDPGKWWPIAIVSVLAATVGANTVMLFAAGGPQTLAIEPDYYQHAVRWDSTLAQRRVDAELGWQTAVSIGVLDRDGASIELRLDDASGAPIDDADVRIDAVNNLDGSRWIHAHPASAGAGRYAGRIALTRAGLWELRVDVRRGATRFTATRHEDVRWKP